MTPSQRTELVHALESGNDVRVVTIALQLAASAARERRQDDAVAIRKLVDDHHSRESADIQYRRMRLDVAKRIMPVLTNSAWKETDSRAAVMAADALLHAVATIAVPK
jgi:hypothetical protein